MRTISQTSGAGLATSGFGGRWRPVAGSGGECDGDRPGDERPAALLIVCEVPGRTIGQAMGLELVFGDIDADGNLGHLFHVLCLSSGPHGPWYPFRPHGKDGATSL